MQWKVKKHDMALKPRKAVVQDGRRWIGRSRARGLVFAVPALLTLGFAMRPTTHAEDPYVFIADPELDRRIDAYMPVIKETRPYFDGGARVSEAEATRLGNLWVAETEAGKLKSLRPLILGDAVLEGTTGQIIKIQCGLANTLMIRGERRVREGEIRAGAEDLILAARVYRPTQYSDLQTATLVGLQVRRSLSMLDRAARQMTPSERVWLREAILPLRTDNQQLCDMAMTMRRLFEEQAWKSGETLPETPGLVALSSLRRASNAKPNEAMAHVSDALKASKTPEELRPLTGSLRQVLSNEMATNNRIETIRSL